MSRPLVVWDRRMLGYHHATHHPMDPIRWELTWALASELGVLDHYQVLKPEVADDETLGAIVTHVLVHEVGHHFGLSDDDMHAIEAGAG